MIGSITDRINRIRQQIPSGLRLIAVTKQVSVTQIREAYAAGIRDFGENRLQDALIKQQQLQDLSDVSWHFIGHVQKNKAKKVLENFHSIHSVDSLALALHLDGLATQSPKKPIIYLQVKVLPDPNKYGWSVPALLADLPQLNNCHNLNIQGLMTILPLGLNEAQTLAAFETTRELAKTIQQQNWSNLKIEELSMGMSSDYLLAIKAGATAIRLGTVIFS